MIRVPTISEAAAKRQLSAARAVLTREERKLDNTPSGYSIWTGAGVSDAYRRQQGRVQDAERKVTAAICRLDAIRSQQPDRHPGAWVS